MVLTLLDEDQNDYVKDFTHDDLLIGFVHNLDRSKGLYNSIAVVFHFNVRVLFLSETLYRYPCVVRQHSDVLDSD
jgi:hypothetical protein